MAVDCRDCRLSGLQAGRLRRRAMPSARPSAPRPSVVVALRAILSTGQSSAVGQRLAHRPAMAARGAARRRRWSGRRFPGASRRPAGSARRGAAARCRVRRASGASVDGNHSPMSPRSAAPSSASISAWTAASPSEWPASPRGWGIRTPPSHSGTPSAKACTSRPEPTRITRGSSIARARAKSSGW